MAHSKGRESAGSSTAKTKGKRHSNGDGGAAGANGSQVRTLMNGGFAVVKVGSHHVWFVRKNQSGGGGEAGDDVDDRTMFVVNLPVDTTEKHIRALYAQQAGAIESVRLWKGKGVDLAMEEEEEEHDDSKAPKVIPLPPLDPRHPFELLPTSTSAHVTFLDASSLRRALHISHFASWPDAFDGAADQSLSAPPVGLAYLVARHRSLRPSLDVVRSHVDSVISNFEYRIKNPPKRKVRAIEAVSVGPNGELLDADGFTIVQPTGKYGRTTESGENGAGASVRVARKRSQASGAGRRRKGDDDGEGPDAESTEHAKKKKRLELDDFYRFQKREAKRQELADLRVKFRADQEKIKQLRANRNFKPF